MYAGGPGGDPGFNWGSLIGGIGALGGGLAQAGAQNNSASLAQQYAAAASQLGGFGLGTGPGGVGATGSPLGGGGNIGFGNFNPAYLGLAGLAGGNTGIAGGIGAPEGLNPALSGAFGTAASGLGGFNPAAPGFAGNADLLAAGGLANQAGQGLPGMASQYYNALQQLQSPANINAANSLGNSLFGRGMLGSSSGGILGQQFGQGLAQQSAANAAAAQQLGIQGLGATANAATGLTWMGSNALNSAFSNFGNAAMLAPNVQSSYLNPALAGITGAGNLTNTGLGLYNAGLQGALGQNLASSRAGYLGMANANSPNQQSPYGQLLGNLFGGLAMGGQQSGGGNGILNSVLGSNGPGGGVNGWLKNLFGGGSSGVDLSGVGGIGGASESGLYDAALQGGGSPDLSALFGGGGFSSAGGGAAAGADLGVGTAGVGGGALGAPGFGAEMAGGEFGIPLSGTTDAGAAAAAADTAGTVASGAGGMFGAGAGTAGTVATAALPLAAMAALYGVFQHNSQLTPLQAFEAAKSNSAGMTMAGAAPYNQPGTPYGQGVDIQGADATAANAWSQIAAEMNNPANAGAIANGTLYPNMPAGNLYPSMRGNPFAMLQ